MKIQVTGGKAIAVLLVFGGMWAFQQWQIRTTLSSEAVRTLKPFLAGKLINSALTDVSHGRELSSLTPSEQKTLGDRILAARKVEITSISARGLSSDLIVRVEYLVDGRLPPDGKSVRYFRMKYSTILGWTYGREVGAFSYWVGI